MHNISIWRYLKRKLFKVAVSALAQIYNFKTKRIFISGSIIWQHSGWWGGGGSKKAPLPVFPQ